MTVLLQALLVPLSGLLLGVGVLLGGKAGQVLTVLAVAGFGTATVLTLATA
jgi:hypothetical protein